MKRLTILICVLAMLLALTGVASADPPQPGKFTIRGITTSIEPWPPKPLPSGRYKLHMIAEGGVAPEPETDATGYFTGTFTYEERIMVDLDSGRGTNHGIMTITADGSKVVIRFGGRADFQNVWGHFTVLHGTGDYTGLHGQGRYEGVPDVCYPISKFPFYECLGFWVKFTGRFHTDPE